jgi:hypothetical protein
MHELALGLAALVALAIIVIGALYVSKPRAATRSFGLPLPEDGLNIAWWLRLKGVRDIAAGLGVLAFMVWGGPLMVGIILLVEAIIPIGDNAGHSCSERLGQERLRHPRSDGAANDPGCRSPDHGRGVR